MLTGIVMFKFVCLFGHICSFPFTETEGNRGARRCLSKAKVEHDRAWSQNGWVTIICYYLLDCAPAQTFLLCRFYKRPSARVYTHAIRSHYIRMLRSCSPCSVDYGSLHQKCQASWCWSETLSEREKEGGEKGWGGGGWGGAEGMRGPSSWRAVGILKSKYKRPPPPPPAPPHTHPTHPTTYLWYFNLMKWWVELLEVKYI